MMLDTAGINVLIRYTRNSKVHIMILQSSRIPLKQGTHASSSSLPFWPKRTDTLGSHECFQKLSVQKLLCHAAKLPRELYNIR